MERLELFEKDRGEDRRASHDEELGDDSFVTVSSPASSPEKGQSIQTTKVAVRALAQMVPTSSSFLGI